MDFERVSQTLRTWSGSDEPVTGAILTTRYRVIDGPVVRAAYTMREENIQVTGLAVEVGEAGAYLYATTTGIVLTQAGVPAKNRNGEQGGQEATQQVLDALREWLREA